MASGAVVKQNAGVDELFRNAARSISDAESFMSKAKPGIEKAKASKENQGKIVSKANGVVNALLEPASKVADLLKHLGKIYPPCSAAGSILQGIVDIETGRRENDVRIGVVYVEFSTTLIQLGSLKPGFQNEKGLLKPLEVLLLNVKSLMEQFGQFCESFYEGKGLKNKFKHFVQFKPNAKKLDQFHGRLAAFKSELTLLLTQQAVLIVSSNTATLNDVESKIDKMYNFFSGLKDEPEAIAEEFISNHGGELAVLKNDSLMKNLAKELRLDLSSNILRTVKESFDESFKQSHEAFQLKLQFAIDNRIEISTDTIIKEIQNGPYELIQDPDMKSIWKGIAPKESNLKRRQFIDAMVYYFNMQWKQFRVELKVDRDDYWVRSIIGKVYYHPAIGDAIDDDASGYISVEEVNEFMQRKPSDWTTPQWVAYWAYGWDADNTHYQEQINKAYKQLKSLSEKPGTKGDLIKEYLDETQKDIEKLANSLFRLENLNAAADTQMKKLQEEWRRLSDTNMKKRLKTVNFRIEYDSMAAVCGSERIEVNLLPLVSHLLARHSYIMSQNKVTDDDIEEATTTMRNILDIVSDRINSLRHIWRRQRHDVDVQMRYYVNGLFQDYYKAHLEEFETDDEEDLSDWDSEDEWGSEDDEDHNEEDGGKDIKAPSEPTSHIADEHRRAHETDEEERDASDGNEDEDEDEGENEEGGDVAKGNGDESEENDEVQHVASEQEEDDNNQGSDVEDEGEEDNGDEGRGGVDSDEDNDEEHQEDEEGDEPGIISGNNEDENENGNDDDDDSEEEEDNEQGEDEQEQEGDGDDLQDDDEDPELQATDSDEDQDDNSVDDDYGDGDDY